MINKDFVISVEILNFHKITKFLYTWIANLRRLKHIIKDTVLLTPVNTADFIINRFLFLDFVPLFWKHCYI